MIHALRVLSRLVNTVVGDDLELEESVHFGVIPHVVEQLELEDVERLLEVVGALADPLYDQVKILVVDDLLEGIHALDGLLLLPQL